jgi:hypothetical protein
MGMLGIGAMIHALGGGSSINPTDLLGKTITKAELKDNALYMYMSDGKNYCLYDNGQSCCEYRHMECDDPMTNIIGGQLTELSVREVTSQDEDYQCHDICFLVIGTDKGFITVANHNEHNGYYGGFGLDIEEVGNVSA